MIASACTLTAQPGLEASAAYPLARPSASRRAVRSVTILTPLLNSLKFFQQTQRSVMSQAGDFDLQWLVIDGGSGDGTCEMLRSIRDPRFQWISEPDAGQAAAINKGLAMARGDVVAWLNGDDLYAPGAIAAAVEAFNENPDAQWLVGRCNIIDEQDRPIRRGVSRYKEHLMENYSFRNLLRTNMINQPAVFWRRSFGQGIGSLDESLYYTMDYDLWLRMARRKKPLILNRLLASFRVHRCSKSRGGCREQFVEGYRVASRYFEADRFSRWAHRFNVEKIVWGYRALQAIGR